MTLKWTRPLLAASVGLLATLGCAEEREPINRVQPNALEKSFFVGADLQSEADNPAFYANGTVLDIGYGATQDAFFDGFYANDLSIIRWQITEDRLIGRLAYERIDGSDGQGAGMETNDGQVIYAFNIQGHFDIKRSYNPSTGEELNVIEENTSDAPWYERKYFRVDWSRNLITEAYDFDTLAIYGIFFGAYQYEETGYYVNDPKDENAPNFEKDYFDVTTKAWAKPQTIDLGGMWGYGEVPVCFFDADFSGGQAPAGNCNPQELTIRHSFWKVQDKDYQPEDWDGFRFQAAGAFTKDRRGFARNYGMVDTQWRRFISRYNIWKRSHAYADPEAMTGATECFTPTTTPVGADPNRDENKDGTADECANVGGGSQCDTFSQKCTLPFAQREVDPIVWYYTNKSDYRYWEGTYWATQEWDVAMRLAVQAARNAECYRTGRTDCEDAFPVPHGQMDSNEDALAIWREVDACRARNGAADPSKRWDTAACEGVADSTIAKRGYADGDAEGRALKAMAMMKDVVILCHSPIAADDPAECAPGEARLPRDVTPTDCQSLDVLKAKASLTDAEKHVVDSCTAAYKVRIGDVRRHLVNVINTPQTGSPWGFGPTYANPLTGEAISASINVWAWPTDFIAQSVVDVSRFIKGELSVADVTDGKFVKDWDKAAQIMSSGGAMAPMTKAEVTQRKADMFQAIGKDIDTGLAAIDENAKVDQRVVQQLQMARNTRASVGATSAMKQKYFARMQTAYGSQTEAELITPAMQQMAGSGSLPTGSALEFASPLRGRINPTLFRDLQELGELGLANRGACLLHADEFAPSPTAMTGMANKLEAKFGAFNKDDSLNTQLERADAMKNYVAQKMHFAVITHEMGHTFGFRHNFVSSSNAFNYRPQYWQLRTRDGAVTTECTDLAQGAEAENCVGPRYYDPVTQEEQDGMIGMWSHSSIMDYAGDYAQDMVGLGGYDFHAAKMMYGDVASVFNQDDMKDGTVLASAINETILDSFGGILGYIYQSAPQPSGQAAPVIHYSQLNKVYKLIDGCTAVNVEDYVPSDWDEATKGKWDPTLDGHLVRVNGQYTRCKQRRLGYVDWDLLSGGGFEAGNTDAQATGGTGPSIAPDGRTRFPYGFATDRWADLGNLAVYRHDQGADAYELFEFLISEQELRHIFDNYRRNRNTFSVRSAANRVLSRYNTKMRDGAKGLGLIYNNIQNIQPGAFGLYVDYFGWGDNMLAAGMAFDHFTRQMQRPNAGPHEEGNNLGITNVFSPLVANDFVPVGSTLLTVPDGPQGYWNTVGIGGKLVNNTLSDNRGEYDSEFTINAGSYYDKVYSTMLLTESVDNFISSSLTDFVDARFRSVSLADLFGDGYRRWLANNLTGDGWVKGARVAATAGGKPVVDAEGYPTQPLGWISWWPSTPEVCFPNEGTSICSAYGKDGTSFKPNVPEVSRALDPQIGWEQQKFLIAWTLIYLPENQKTRWLDQMGIWSLGADSDPGFDNRIEFHMPTGEVYIARTYGSETFCFGKTTSGSPACKTVQRGIGARILEYANELLNAAYQTTEVDHNGVTWYVPVMDSVTGQPLLKSGTSCESSAACLKLVDFVSVPDFMRQAMHDFGMADPSMKGIYGTSGE
ncbi:MAG: zinc-dependent metalloprotease [Polyangiaceae bacterium]|nr:zinc-dependent metalloprotease [Polyangiaceae bacterium]